MSTYSGLLARSNFEDDGTIPASEYYWVSPDIIPNGNNALDFDTAAHTYDGPDIGQPIVANLNNNIYVRCKNKSTSTMMGDVNLFYANASLFLLPSTWTPVTVSGKSIPFVIKSESLYIPSEAIALTQFPFLLSDLPAGHYCLIAVVNNNNVPFGVPQEFSSNAEFAKWVRYNPNVAQRNIERQQGSLSNIVTYLTFGNANPIESRFYITMTGYGIPAQTHWDAQCVDSRFPKPFHDSGTFSSQGLAGTQITVPPNVGTGSPLMTMTFTFSTPDGQPFPDDAYFLINYYQLPTSQAESPQLFEAEREVVREYNVLSIASAGVEAQELIELGSVEVRAS